MTKTIRWGIIGCGDVTERKSGPALQRASGSSLVAVMRRQADLARDYAQRHGVPHWFDDADKLIAEVDAVYIATPPSSHKQYALACARAGKPAYVEKPMAIDAASCREMIDAFEQARLGLFVAYYRRALPRFLRIKKLVESGATGRVRFAQITYHRPVHDRERDPSLLPWRVIPSIAGGGHFVDLASHTLDYLAYVLGDIEQATGIASNQAGLYPAEDCVVASMRFTSGVIASGVWCFAAAARVDQIAIVGDSGSIRFSTFGDDPVQVTTAQGVSEFMIPNPDPIQQPLIQTVVDELNGTGRCPSTGQSAIGTTWAIDQILSGYRASQR
jgi:1,5-anhydro-D-fructose reductase (1,5-anhydro-D-mannitol-forming)